MEVQEVGKLFTTKKFAGTAFVVKGEGVDFQKLELPISTIESMINNRDFPMLALQMQLARKSSNIDIMLRFPNGEAYSISGFPRRLTSVGEQSRSKFSPFSTFFQ